MRRPSGDHARPPTSVSSGPRESRRRPPPSGRIDQTSRPSVYASRRPLGAQVASCPPPRRRAALPSGRTRHRNEPASVPCSYTIQRPDGDHRGSATCSAGGIGIRRSSPPSTRISTSERGTSLTSTATNARPPGAQPGHSSDVSSVRRGRPDGPTISRPDAMRWNRSLLPDGLHCGAPLCCSRAIGSGAKRASTRCLRPSSVLVRSSTPRSLIDWKASRPFCPGHAASAGAAAPRALARSAGTHASRPRGAIATGLPGAQARKRVGRP